MHRQEKDNTNKDLKFLEEAGIIRLHYAVVIEATPSKIEALMQFLHGNDYHVLYKRPSTRFLKIVEEDFPRKEVSYD